MVIPVASNGRPPRDPAGTSSSDLKVEVMFRGELMDSNIAEGHVKAHGCKVKYRKVYMKPRVTVVRRTKTEGGTRTVSAKLRPKDKTVRHRTGSATAPRKSLTVKWKFIARPPIDTAVSSHTVAMTVVPRSIVMAM